MASCSLFRKWLDSAFIFSPPAILVIVWDSLMYLQMFLVRYFAATYFSSDTQTATQVLCLIHSIAFFSVHFHSYCLMYGLEDIELFLLV